MRSPIHIYNILLFSLYIYNNIYRFNIIASTLYINTSEQKKGVKIGNLSSEKHTDFRKLLKAKSSALKIGKMKVYKTH